jgi:hypothetical protein
MSPLAEAADRDGTLTAAAPEEATLEAEIAALVQEGWKSEATPGDGHGGVQDNGIDLDVHEARPEPRASDSDFRVSGGERISGPPPDSRGTRAALIVGALLGVLGVGWTFGMVSQRYFGRPASIPLDQKNHASAQTPASERETARMGPETGRSTTPGASPAEAIAPARASAPAHRLRPPQSAARPPVKTSAAAQPNTGSSGHTVADAGHRPNIEPRPVPFPETKPATIEGWSVRDVVGGTAILEGPGGVWRAARGDAVPGVGSVESIVRWGSHWIVATSRGLIASP